MSATRYPLAPLETLARHQAGLPRPSDRHSPADEHADTLWSTRHLATILGVSRRTIFRWRQHGLNAVQADRAACRLDLHPGLIWGDAWWSSTADVELATT